MRKILGAVVLLATPCQAADAPMTVPVWDASLFNKCVDGENLTSLANINDADRLAGAVMYGSKSPTGDKKMALTPLSLASKPAELGSAETPTCEVTFRTTASAGGEIIGFAKANAGTDRLYRLVVRLVSRRRVSDLKSTSGDDITVWEDDAVGKRIGRVLKNYAGSSQAWGVDSISVYIATLEVYDKVNGDLKGGWGIVSTSGTYSKSDSMNIAKSIITAQLRELNPSDYVSGYTPEKQYTQVIGAPVQGAFDSPSPKVVPLSLKTLIRTAESAGLIKEDQTPP